jgi:hypothetical protein
VAPIAFHGRDGEVLGDLDLDPGCRKNAAPHVIQALRASALKEPS